MDNKTKNYLGISLILALQFFIIGGLWFLSSYSRAARPDRSFTVNGEGEVTAIPDVAELSFGVLTEGGKDLAALQKGNTAKVNGVINFLKNNGVEEKDIKTQYYNISPRYQYYTCAPARLIRGEGEYIASPTPCPPSDIVGYSINQSVGVKIRDIDKAGDIIAGVVEAGANNVSGPTFTVDDTTELENQAREQAIVKAREKAKAIAGAGGFRIGRLIGIQEGFSTPTPIFFGRVEAFGKGGDGGPALEPGSQEVQANVTLTYEIR